MTKSGYIELSDLLQVLRQGPDLFYRLALLRDGSEWRLHSLFIEEFPKQGNEETPVFDYDYGSAFFSAGTVDGETVATWLTSRVGELRLLPFDGNIRKFTLQPFSDKLLWSRYESYAVVDFHRSPWPLMRYGIATFGQQPLNTDTGFLLSDTAPFFPDFRTAVLRLVYQATEVDVTTQMPGATVVIRRADTSAWLSNIKLSPTRIEVTVSGSLVAGAQLTISGAGQNLLQRHFVTRTSVACDLSGSIPTPLWIMLSRGNECLDYYHRDERWTAFNSTQQPNVMIDVGDARSEIEALIPQGEGPEVEFKRELAVDKKRILNTISAFANGAGGTILLGISDDGATHGIAEDPNSLRDTLIRTIRDNIVPMPEVHVSIHEREGKSIIAIYVGRSAIHACGVNPADPRYYVRRGASNFPARPEEITSIVLSRQPMTPINYLNQG